MHPILGYEAFVEGLMRLFEKGSYGQAAKRPSATAMEWWRREKELDKLEEERRDKRSYAALMLLVGRHEEADPLFNEKENEFLDGSEAETREFRDAYGRGVERETPFE